MKKALIFIVLMIALYLCVKSSLGFGEKETFVDVMNEKQKNNIENVNTNNDSLYTSTNPIELEYELLDGKYISSNMLILNKDITIKDLDTSNFDYDMNTYILINFDNKNLLNIEPITLKKDNINLNIKIEKTEENNTLLLILKNIKITNLKYLTINEI